MAIPIPQVPPLPPAGTYEMLNLRQYDFADYHPLLLHMTGRGSVPTECDDPAVVAASPSQRLAAILSEGRLRGFPMFGTGVRAVCFTENSRSALNWLISTGRHVPWGVAFSKDLVFKQGGGPAIEVRGDDWPTTEFWPAELRARVKRLWPGAQAAPGATIPWYLEKQSEWSFEREWRLPINDLLFQPADVALVICESEAGLLELVKSVRERSEPMALHLEQRHHLIWDPALKVLKP